MSELKKVLHRFESPDSFINYCERVRVIDGPCGRDKASDQMKARDWCDTKDFRAALRKARDGDEEIAKLIKPKDVELTQHGAMTCTTYDVDGDFVEVGRYLSGEPECMGSVRRKGKPIINILVNSGANCFIEATTIKDRGKAILEIMSGLEANGYGVEINLVLSINSTGNRYINNAHTVYVKVKDSKEYFNLTSLAFWLVSPSVLRRLKFRMVEGESEQMQRAIGINYGSSANIPQSELDAMPDCIYFPRVDENGASYEQAIKQIVEKYKA